MFCRFFPTFFLAFLHFSPFSSISTPFWTIFLHFLFPPFSSIFHPFSTIFLPFLSFFHTFFLAFLHFSPFSLCFQRFSFLFCRFFPTFFLAFLFSPFSLCFQRFSFVFFLPFSCHSSIFLHFPPVFNDFPSFSGVFFLLFPGIPPFSFFLSFLHFPPFPPGFQRFSFLFSRFFSYLFLGIPASSPCFQWFSFVFFLPFSCTIFLHFPSFVNGPRGNRSLPSPLCVVVHAPQKSSIYPPSTATNFEILVPYATTTPQTP